jgi:hypothetical protein
MSGAASAACVTIVGGRIGEGKAQPGRPVTGESQQGRVRKLGSADEQHSLSKPPASLLAEHVSLEDPYALRHCEESR